MDGTLDKAALAISSPQEYSVDSEEDPAALLEQDCGTKNTEPEEDFKSSDKSHRGVVIFLDEFANGVSCGRRFRGGSAAWRSTGSGLLRGRDGGKDVGTRVGRNMEDGVDHEWQ